MLPRRTIPSVRAGPPVHYHVVGEDFGVDRVGRDVDVDHVAVTVDKARCGEPVHNQRIAATFVPLNAGSPVSASYITMPRA